MNKTDPTFPLAPRLSLVIALMIALVPASVRAADPIERVPYDWGHVPWGGGYVTGLAVHPTARDVIYARTDMGTGYRYDPAAGRWRGILDWIPDEESNLLGPESVAVDPTDPTGNTVYFSIGRYAQDWAHPQFGDIVKSSDGGKTRPRPGLQIAVASNNDQPFGERLAVDPLDGKVVYYASRGHGLLRSVDAGEPGTWHLLKSAPTGDTRNATAPELGGLSFTAIDSTGGPITNGTRSRIVYVGVYGQGVARTTDGGDNWQILPGSPTHPNRAIVGPDGRLLVSHDAGVARFDGEAWTDITPPGFAGQRFGAVGIDPRDPQHLLVGRLDWKWELPIFQSHDGGQTWRTLKRQNTDRDPGEVAYLRPGIWDIWGGAPSDFEFDPHRPGEIWLTDWLGMWRCADITAERPKFVVHIRGHEQGVSLTLCTPPAGPPLLVGAADANGFRFASVEEYPDRPFELHGEGYAESTGIDYAEQRPQFMARIASVGWRRDRGGRMLVSDDAGKTWTPCATQPPGAWGGRVAVSADGAAIVWLPSSREGAAPWVSHDRGNTWQRSADAPARTLESDNIWNWHHPLAADRADADAFYILSGEAAHVSRDAGRSFTRAASDLTHTGSAPRVLRVAPGIAGSVWVSRGDNGLSRSDDYGRTFRTVDAVQSCRLFAFGTPRDPSRPPTLFVLGTIGDRFGVYRSEDLGQSWVAIDQIERVALATANCMEGDRQTFGRVYIGSNGRGVWMASPMP
ncbi:MAG TPA: hypothetical protein PKB10_03495 [Tepidisphaeraceae bacterium]|nr:hypothetical protein [Tepidisphaeraceae bacterium]